MNVELMAHAQLSRKFVEKLKAELEFAMPFTSGKAIALTAIRTCYSPCEPSEIVSNEGEKYFGNKATDGKGGSEADRLFRMIVRSGHTSTLEHLSFTFAIEGVSRTLLAQLTRHRVGFSYSVQSQRYVKFGSGDRSGGFNYVTPESINKFFDSEANVKFSDLMLDIQNIYDELRKLGIPAEDARAVLPNAAACNLVMTTNLRALLEFYAKRKPGKGAQAEIAGLAEALKKSVVEVEPWTSQFFDK
ncbi:FAD-dependent thymidylate synthase [Neobacillus sp. 19]|uniref:FAD-dependent thymidylate synthase n=1 Tax=Neobacillus sp. 19 TaxID=3394458 RepID=UPI003BF6F6B0